MVEIEAKQTTLNTDVKGPVVTNHGGLFDENGMVQQRRASGLGPQIRGKGQPSVESGSRKDCETMASRPHQNDAVDTRGSGGTGGCVITEATRLKLRREAFEKLGGSTSPTVLMLRDLEAIQRRRDLRRGVAPSAPLQTFEVPWELYLPDCGKRLNKSRVACKRHSSDLTNPTPRRRICNDV